MYGGGEYSKIAQHLVFFSFFGGGKGGGGGGRGFTSSPLVDETLIGARQ